MAEQRIGTFTPEQTRELWQFYQEYKQLQPRLQENFPNRRPIDEPSPHRMFVVNKSGEEIPAWACMEVFGTEQRGNITAIKVRKPTTICGEYLFNSQFPIPTDEGGWGYRFGLVFMLGSASSYAACKRYKPSENSWSVAEGPGPFLVYGQHYQLDGVVIGRIVGDHCKARWIKFNYTVGGSNSTVTPTDYWDGQDPSECGTVNVDYPLGEPCVNATVVAVYDPEDNVYHAIATESAMYGPGSDVSVVTGATFDTANCGTLNIVKRPMKALCLGNPSSSTSAPIFTLIEVLTSCGLVEEDTTCSGSCVWEFGPTDAEPTGEWYLYSSDCSSDCGCGDPPTTPPEGGIGEGPPYPRQTIACARNSPTTTGLAFNKAGILVCGYTPSTSGPCVIETSAECPPTGSGS